MKTFRLLPRSLSICFTGVALVLGALPAAAATAGRPAFAAGQVVVRGAAASSLDVPGARVVKVLPWSGLTVLEVAGGQEAGAVARLRSHGRAAYRNRRLEALEAVDDPYRSYQWHFDKVQAAAAWDVTHGEGVVVAVVDTGLALGGRDGLGCAYNGYDAVDLDGNPDDPVGHGTHVSGTIAQATDNAVGVAGLAWGACVLPVRVLDSNGDGTAADIAEGLYWAVDHGAQVINLSLGTHTSDGVVSDPLMDPALDYARAHGVTVVAAAGNDGDRTTLSYPAIHPGVISVGATDFTDAVAWYSNGGPQLDLVAPGGDVSVDRNGDGNGDGVLQEVRSGGVWLYGFLQGTSMATPHVAAAAAMLYAVGVDDPDTVRTALTATARDLGPAGRDSGYGNGLLQIADALAYATTSSPPPPPPTNQAPAAAFGFDCSDLSCAFSDASTDADGSVVGWAWSFGDGGSSGQRDPSHGFAAGGSYQVTLTVTDDDGATASTARTVTVTAPPPPAPGITLAVAARKEKGRRYVDLSWSGAGTAQVEVWRDGQLVASTANDGAATDALPGHGGGTFSYEVCETGRAACSPARTASF